MNYSLAAEPKLPSANPKWRLKTGRIAGETIDHSPMVCSTTSGWLTAPLAYNRTGSRKEPIKCGNR